MEVGKIEFIYPSDELLAAVNEEIRHSRMLQAYKIAQEAGPLARWAPGGARTSAGRLVFWLGARRLSAALHITNHRHAPEDERALFYYACEYARRVGTYDALRFVEGRLPLIADQRVRADLLALSGFLLGTLRDFGAAFAALDEADAVLGEHDPWLMVERADVLEMADRRDEALALSKAALEIRPWYRPALLQTAGLLSQSDRDGEAIAVLEEALDHTENSGVPMRLQGFYSEQDDAENGLRCLELCERWMPLADKDLAEWIAARRSDYYYHLGDFEAARLHAEAAGEGYHEAVTKRLADPENWTKSRVRLPVGFVRQNRMTCGPATLTALSQYWGAKVDHLDVAEEICYDGTPAHSERRWAESRGMIAAEFRVTPEAIRALIDRGVPFTLTTVEPTSAHLQALIGYDDRIGVLLIRDPTLRHYREFVEEPFFKGYAATGPRGMLVLPEAEAARLDGIELPERDLYDLLNRLQSALEAHRRHEAEAAYRDLCAAAPGHRLTYQALRALGAYDGDARKRLEAAEGMRRLFPEDQRSLLGLFYELDGTGTRSDRLALLGEALALDSPHSAFYLRRAEILAEDARTHEAAAWNFRRAHRRAPQDAEALRGWASLLWEQREFAEATRLYRFASCLEEKREDLATTYARACRITGRAEEGIAFLHDRLTRFGHQAAYPAITMFLALEEADRLEDGFRILEWAMERRPDDAALMLFAARKFGAYGQRERAESLLAGADERGSRREWLSAAASLAEQRGDLEASRDHWRALLEIAPLTESAHSAIARITGELEGPEAAIAGIAATRADFPFHSGLASLHVNWLREAESPESEKVLRAMIEHDPDNDWARRELALELRRLGRVGEAVDEARRAVEADPHGSYSHSVLGGMLLAAGDRDAARDSLRRAVELDADNCGAIDWLFEASPGAAARHESIAFLSEQIERQATLGEAILHFQRVAFSLLDPPELLAFLERANQARPDLWQSWAARMQQLIAMDRAAEAVAIGEVCTQRFPLLPRTWLDLAECRSASGNFAGQVEALRRALDINPSWSTARRALAQALERTGDLDGAVAEARRAVQGDRLVPQCHGVLAKLLWQAGQRAEAFDAVRTAAELDRHYGWGWDMLGAWAGETGREAEAEAAAQKLVADRPGDAVAWTRLAEMLTALARPLEDQLAAIEEGLRCDPLAGDLHDWRALRLARLHRFDEAIAACNPPAYGGQPTRELRGRAAWIKYQRGDSAGAIREMEAILAEEPDYYFASKSLVDWYFEANEFEKAEGESLRLIRLSPQDAIAHGGLAYARLQRGDKDGAAAPLERALEFDPEYPFAARNLFEIRLENGDVEGAGRVVETMRRYQDGAWTDRRELELAIATDDGPRFDATAARLLARDSTGEGAILDADKLVRAKNWLQRWSEAIHQALQSGEVGGETPGILWVRARVARNGIAGTEKFIAASSFSGVAHSSIWTGLVQASAQVSANDLKGFVRRRRKILAAHTEIWGETGKALIDVGLDEQALDWLKGWRGRAGVSLWMVNNLAAATDTVKGIEAGNAVRLDAADADLASNSFTRAVNAAPLAFMAASRGDAEAADHWFGRLDADQLPNYHRFLFHLAHAAQSANLNPTAGCAQDIANAVARALDANPQWDRDRALCAYHARARKHLKRVLPAHVWSSPLVNRLNLPKSRAPVREWLSENWKWLVWIALFLYFVASKVLRHD